MSIVSWEDPPPARLGHWQRCALELSENPGEWALVVQDRDREYACGSAARRLRELGCEVTVRFRGPNCVSVWARWPEVA